MIDNAVAHYTHLRTQGKKPSEALAHVAQRFGVTEADMRKRVNGTVVNHVGTMEALAAAKAYIERRQISPGNNGSDAEELLCVLYGAVTGEPMTGRDRTGTCQQPWSSHGNHAHTTDCPAEEEL